ncbi:MAG: AAA family ATPase [Zoogloeaceae bacterium]|jgi:hypothetical protein|nr:AAA family ATPase [Zoogloeaceae bacterium]
MKITSIEIANFLGIRAFSARLDSPVTLIAGKNGSGKTSIQEAARMALTGEPSRVRLKKDYAALVREGEKRAAIVLTGVDDHGQGWTAHIELPSGKGQPANDSVLPWVLDAQRFASMNANERRKFLFGLMEVRTDFESVKRRLDERGCDAEKIGLVAPMLRAGFESAKEDAANRARDAKSTWRVITNESWGKDKAEKWTPGAPPEGAERAGKLAQNAREKQAEAEAALSEAQRELGRAEGAIAEKARRAFESADLKQKAGLHARIVNKLAHDEEKLRKWKGLNC